jgi:hypothetical protein
VAGVRWTPDHCCRAGLSSAGYSASSNRIITGPVSCDTEAATPGRPRLRIRLAACGGYCPDPRPTVKTKPGLPAGVTPYHTRRVPKASPVGAVYTVRHPDRMRRVVG